MIEEKSLVYFTMRLILGSIFIYHGISKVGSGYTDWMSYMNSLNINTIFAVFAIIFEIFIGFFIILGLYTRLVSLGGIIFMFIALYLAHSKHPILGENGISYQILIILICVGLTLTGGGKYSIIKD